MAASDPAIPKTAKGYEVDGALSWWAGIDMHEVAPELIWPRNLYIYDRMRRQDAQVMSVLRAVTLPVRRTQWRIDPSGAPARVVYQVADDLGLPIVGKPNRPTAQTEFDFGEHLRLALLKLVFGHSFFEQVYEVRADGKAHLSELGWRPPRTISQVDVNNDGTLRAVHQWGILGQKDEVIIPAGQLVAYVTDREGGNWLGQSLLRPAYKFWLLKDRLLRVQAQTIDRNGLGIPTYTASEVPPGIEGEDARVRQQAEIDAGNKLAQSVRAGDNAGMAIPHGATFTMKGVEGALPDATKPIGYYDDMIARAVLAHFLNLGGDNSTGSYALGDTFADFFTLSLQTVAQEIADVFTKSVITDIVRLNYGQDVPIPRLTFEEIGSRSQATSQAVYQLVTSGALTMDDPLEDFLRDKFQLPPRDPTTARAKPAPGGAAGAESTDPPDGTDNGSKPPDGSTDGTEGNAS